MDPETHHTTSPSPRRVFGMTMGWFFAVIIVGITLFFLWSTFNDAVRP